MNIDKEKWYGVNDLLAMKVLPVDYRVGVIERIKSGMLKAINTGNEKPRYRIKGEWLIENLAKLDESVK